MSDPVRRLYRSRSEKVLAGVCGGLADYFSIDPTVVRLIFVAAALLGVGGGLLIYVIMALVVPLEP